MSIPVVSSKCDTTVLIPQKGINGKWGYVDADGIFRIKPNYETAFDFKEGLALVSLFKKFGYIDANGRPVISLQYDGAKSFSEGLAAVMIVRDDVDLAALRPELLDARYPLPELVLRIEIIVAGIAAGAFPEPVLMIPTVKADVSELGGRAHGRGFDRVLEEGLVDVAEAGPVLAEHPVETGCVPARVTNLDGQGIAGEEAEEAEEVIGVLGRVGVGPGELEEEGGQTALQVEQVDSGSEFVGVPLGKTFTLVGEGLMELHGEKEIRAVFDFLQPGPGQSRAGRPVEGAVDLDDVDVVGEVGQGVEAAALLDRIDDAVPVLVAPARGADVILGHAPVIVPPAEAIHNSPPLPNEHSLRLNED